MIMFAQRSQRRIILVLIGLHVSLLNYYYYYIELCTKHQYFNVLDLSKSKVFAENKLNLASVMEFIFEREENYDGNREMLFASISSFSNNVFNCSSQRLSSKGLK